MRTSLRIALGIILGCLGIGAILICGFLALTIYLGNSLFPTDGQGAPTYSVLGESITFDDFVITVDIFEFSDSYETYYQTTRNPPEGGKFAWVHIKVQNLGQTAEYAPSTTDFKLIYFDDEIYAEVGDRRDYPDYTGGVLIGDKIFPEVVNEGWLRFTVPLAAETTDLKIFFNPWGSTGDHMWKPSP